MAFPNFEGKHAHDAFFSPHDAISYAYQNNLLPDFIPPQSVIFCYQRRLLRQILAQEEVEQPL